MKNSQLTYSRLVGDRVVLRKLTPKDFGQMLDIKPSPEYFYYIGEKQTNSVFSSRDRLRIELESVASNPNIWFIFVNKQIIGNAFFHNFENNGRSAYFAIGIFEKRNWGKSYGYETITLLLVYGFTVLGLNIVNLTVLEYHDAAIYLYKKCGFSEVGRTESNVRINGEFAKEIVMQLARESYLANRTGGAKID